MKIARRNNMQGCSRILLAVSFAMFFLAVSVPVHAATIQFTTAAGATNGGQPVYGEALFVTGTNSLTVTLTNLLVNPISIAQNISGITFTASSGSNVSTTTVTPTANYINVLSGGTTTSDPGPAVWTYGGTSSLYTLIWNGSGSTTPAFTIIGAPDASGVYSNANGSLTTPPNKPHNPYIDQVATFTLSIAGISSGTNITNITMLFGTSGTPVSVPEPGTMVLLGVGLIGLASLGRKRIRK